VNPALWLINAIGFVMLGVLGLIVALAAVFFACVAIAAVICLPFYRDDWRSVPGAMIPGGEG
jgi:uncharacterized membrane protein YccF (DUF307 family)